MEIVKRQFGSFYSSNIEEQLIEAEKNNYSPPELPIFAPLFEEYTNKENDIEFGKSMKRKHFYLDEKWVFLNHGAFGAAIKEAIEFKHKWNIYIECQPLKFLDREYFPQLVHVQKRLSEFIGCSPMDIVLTPNATTAINSVLKSLKFDNDSTIYYLNTAYGSVKKLIKHLSAQTSNLTCQEESLNFPVTDHDILDLIRTTLKPNTTLAIFDHISSNYAFTMPIKEIINICHSRNVPVLIDGAHALGTLPLNLSKLGADFYVSNAHKWLCNPKGFAFLYVDRKMQNLIKPVVVSHGHGFGFQSEFSWTGLNDYTSFFAIHATLNFWKAVNPEQIRNYNKGLLHKAIELLCNKWNGHLLAPKDNHDFMCCIALPKSFYCTKQTDYNDAEQLQKILYDKYFIEVPIKAINGKLYVRISAHIHNEIIDYIALAEAISKLNIELNGNTF